MGDGLLLLLHVPVNTFSSLHVPHTSRMCMLSLLHLLHGSASNDMAVYDRTSRAA
jgi:hypothetical protein